MQKFILFYSKYSKFSTELLNFVVAREDCFHQLQKICVDSKVFRDILSKSKFEMKYVPTILIIDKSVEIYEGEQAFEWVNITYSSFTKEKEENEKQQRKQVENEIEQKMTQQKHQQVTSTDDLMKTIKYEEPEIEFIPQTQQKSPTDATSLKATNIAQQILEMQRSREEIDKEIKTKNPQI